MENEKMQQCHDLFIKLIRGYLTGEMEVNEEFENADWNKLHELSYRTGLTPMLCEPVKKVYSRYPFKTDIYQRFINGTIVMALKEETKIEYVERIVKAAAEKDIQVLVFKGPIIADAYKDYRMRVSSDTDMYVDEKDKDAMMEILESLGYQWLQDKSKDHVQNLTIPNVHYVELHTALWEDFKGSRIKVLESFELTAPKNRICDKFCGVMLDTIRHEEQLIYFVYHFAKHMVLESASIRNVMDILLFYKKHKDKIDEASFKERLERLGYWKCFCILCQVGEEYLGFRADDLPCYAKTDSESLDQVLKVLFSEQVTRDDDIYRWQMVYNMTPYLTGDYDPNMSGVKRKLKYLFPTRSNMPEKYSYAKKSVFLVPIAWVHRIFDYIVSRFFKRNYRMAGSKRMSRMDAKLQVLKKMKLI